jgi:hypothetical protein
LILYAYLQYEMTLIYNRLSIVFILVDDDDDDDQNQGGFVRKKGPMTDEDAACSIS